MTRKWPEIRFSLDRDHHIREIYFDGQKHVHCHRISPTKQLKVRAVRALPVISVHKNREEYALMKKCRPDGNGGSRCQPIPAQVDFIFEFKGPSDMHAPEMAEHVSQFEAYFLVEVEGKSGASEFAVVDSYGNCFTSN